MHVTRAEDVPKLISNLKNETDVLGRYTEEMHRMMEHRRGHLKKDRASSNGPTSGGVVTQ